MGHGNDRKTVREQGDTYVKLINSQILKEGKCWEIFFLVYDKCRFQR